MPYVAVSDGVQLTRASTAGELEKCLESLPHEARFDVARELDERGQAHGYDGVSQFAYYLQRENTDVLVWTWSPIASYWEAAILLSLIKSLKEPLSEGTAIELLDRATNRRVELVIAPRRHRPPVQEVGWTLVAFQQAFLAADRVWRQVRIARRAKPQLAR